MNKIFYFRLKSLFYFVFLIFIQSKIIYTASDFYTALKNYQNGNYQIIRTNCFSLSKNYLNSFKLHQKRAEILSLLIQRLIERKTYLLVFDYIKKFDYLQIDTKFLDDIALNLGTEGFFIDELLHLLPNKEFYYAYLQTLIENNNLARKGEYKLAEARLAEYIKKHKNGKYYYSAPFKMGTIKYPSQEFDASAHYYNLTSADSELRCDALKNQIIALKKSELWIDLIENSKNIIEICPESSKAEYYFETDYAYLRSGNTGNTIGYLKISASLKFSIDYYHWLDGVYLGKGDCIHAIYHCRYRRIIKEFGTGDV